MAAPVLPTELAGLARDDRGDRFGAKRRQKLPSLALLRAAHPAVGQGVFAYCTLTCFMPGSQEWKQGWPTHIGQ